MINNTCECERWTNVTCKSIFHIDLEREKKALTHKGKTASFTISERHMLNIKAVKLQALTASQVIFTCSSIKNRTNRKYVSLFLYLELFSNASKFFNHFQPSDAHSKLSQTHRWKEDLPMNGHFIKAA